MLVLNLPFKALMFLTLMRPSLVLFLVLWLKLVKDFLKVRCRLALLPFLISCLIWLDLVASLPLIKERILVIIRSEERFSRNDETDLVCRLLLEKKKKNKYSKPSPGIQLLLLIIVLDLLFSRLADICYFRKSSDSYLHMKRQLE